MKNVCFILLFNSFIHTAFSQSINASGIVKNEDGKSIPGAMVSEFKSKSASATYTDSLGFFNFPVSVYSKLSISCNGYNDTLINMADKKNISIILSKSKAGKHLNNSAGDNTENSLINKNLMQDAVSTQSGVNNNYVYGGGVRNYTGHYCLFLHIKKKQRAAGMFSTNGQMVRLLMLIIPYLIILPIFITMIK